MTFETSAFEREIGLHPTSPNTHRANRSLSDAHSSSGPNLTWVGPMEVMMEGCRYRLVPAEPALATEEPSPSSEPLTRRETQIARLVAEGLVNKQIAHQLAISEWTVSTHLRRIFAKLGVETRAAMVLRCFGK
ncbi:MAG: response regulator transcription factor [Polyangiaceae bacterium]|nr:response regulator transcription factor [Polyangiaceae bacterium]